jgi:protein-ribulosamine 3-kinase
MMSLWKHIEQQITQYRGREFSILQRDNIGGGSINNAFRISDGKDSYFVKTNRHTLAYMFEAEARALNELAKTDTIKVPRPISCGISGSESYSILCWLDLSGKPNGALFGRKLAQLHDCKNDSFGFYIDNTIGATPQLNQWSNDWVDFWKKQRLGYQLELCRKNALGHRLYDLGSNLLQQCEAFFASYKPQPSLLHGDLWSGNWAGNGNGEPVIFDPACYYGDREAELAMMELFGHPGQQFFAAYQESYTLDAGYKIRKVFYNLYHILNHANMFGAAYAMQAENMIESLLAELR